MLDTFRHQLAVWRYGASLLLIVAAWAAICLAAGGLAMLALSLLPGIETSLQGWGILTGLVAPFFMHDAAESLATTLERDPPPRRLDYEKAR